MDQHQKEKLIELNNLVTPDVLANQLSISIKTLWYLVRLCNMDVGIPAAGQFPYRHLEVKTKNKVRDVFSPADKIRDIQTMLLNVVWSGIDHGVHSYAYEPGMQLVEPGELLKNSGLIVGLDFKDFFPSISKKKVKDLLTTYGYQDTVASIIATLSCVRYNGFCFLPQGGISSAQIANRIAAEYIDPLVNEYCTENLKDVPYTYVRYSDNIYIGTSKSVHGKDFLQGLSTMLFQHKWRNHKLRVLPYYRQQRVLGMVINEKVNAPRVEYRRFCAALFNIGNCTSREELLDQVVKLATLKVNIEEGKGKLLMSIKGKSNYYSSLLDEGSPKLSNLLEVTKNSLRKIEDLF